MATWIIEPRDPLIVRDGRPFGPIPGARAASLTFPFPSTTTGGVRTRAGIEMGGNFDDGLIAALKKVSVRGPLLVELDQEGEISQWYVPAPVDVVIFESDPPSTDSAVRKQLAPISIPARAYTNLHSKIEDLGLVGLMERDARKPREKTPRFWTWAALEKWLTDPADGPVRLAELGHDGPVSEVRMHVSILPESQSSVEGALFQTRGLEFTLSEHRQRLALAVLTDAAFTACIAPLGGERRMVTWRQSRRGLPGCSDSLRAAIKQAKACRAMLLTPACFTQGWIPTWLLENKFDVRATLRGVAIQRPQVVSGWDFAKIYPGDTGRPKPTRRLAPAGSVFFLSLEGSGQAIDKWIDELWMQCISDELQDRIDGFGLLALGAWSGELRETR